MDINVALRRNKSAYSGRVKYIWLWKDELVLGDDFFGVTTG